jgi:hypothetical protein
VPEAIAASVAGAAAIAGGVPPTETVDLLAAALARARRPVFIAGRGARHGGAGPALSRLAAGCGALLATSAAAKGLFRGSPLDLDVSGGFATPLAAELIRTRTWWSAGLRAEHGRWHGQLIAQTTEWITSRPHWRAPAGDQPCWRLRATAEAATTALASWGLAWPISGTAEPEAGRRPGCWPLLTGRRAGRGRLPDRRSGRPDLGGGALAGRAVHRRR